MYFSFCFRQNMSVETCGASRAAAIPIKSLVELATCSFPLILPCPILSFNWKKIIILKTIKAAVFLISWDLKNNLQKLCWWIEKKVTVRKIRSKKEFSSLRSYFSLKLYSLEFLACFRRIGGMFLALFMQKKMFEHPQYGCICFLSINTAYCVNCCKKNVKQMCHRTVYMRI